MVIRILVWKWTIAQLEFELPYFEAIVQHFCHYTTGTRPKWHLSKSSNTLFWKNWGTPQCAYNLPFFMLKSIHFHSCVIQHVNYTQVQNFDIISISLVSISTYKKQCQESGLSSSLSDKGKCNSFFFLLCFSLSHKGPLCILQESMTLILLIFSNSCCLKTVICHFRILMYMITHAY